MERHESDVHAVLHNITNNVRRDMYKQTHGYRLSTRNISTSNLRTHKIQPTMLRARQHVKATVPVTVLISINSQVYLLNRDSLSPLVAQCGNTVVFPSTPVWVQRHITLIQLYISMLIFFLLFTVTCFKSVKSLLLSCYIYANERAERSCALWEGASCQPI